MIHGKVSISLWSGADFFYGDTSNKVIIKTGRIIPGVKK